MFGVLISKEEKEQERIKEVEMKVQEELEKKQRKDEQLLREKEYANLKSICLRCKNAFIEQYQEDPSPDPMDVVCTKKLQIWGSKAVDRDSDEFFQCHANRWYRKTITCSDFEERIK
jgi:hypothetical protein